MLFISNNYGKISNSAFKPSGSAISVYMIRSI